MEDTFDLIKNTNDKELSMEDISLEDPSTFDMIGRGETSGVFQLESSLTPLCMKIRPRDIRGISDINALGRPSCSPAQRKTYIRRRTGLDGIKYSHPNLSGALKKTYGVSLYEEGMMMVVKDCAGWDLNQADALRKITKLKGKDPALVTRTENSFISDCMKVSKMPYKIARKIWNEEILPFSLYGFNSAHSISYSHLSYYTAWLRNHHPTEFMCALLNNEDPNGDKAMEYINECSNMGIEITPPNINTSGGNYVVSGDKEIATEVTCLL